MPGLVPGIHVLTVSPAKTWMAGTSPAMTVFEAFSAQKRQLASTTCIR
jgi:hypothetical protein